ncbi:MAG: gamma-glutamyltransferase family protein, partial [Acidobacteria bacterium]|nr:gamma-glutamyltransferase family protein [Acidobacteriota bacterium]
MVITRQGIVSTSQALASQAGAQVLARGGSAIDAAIAANAVLGVTEPQMNGIGGDLFVLYWDAKTGKLTGLNSSGWAPQGLSIDFLKKNQHKQMPRTGIHSATAPGCVEGWEKLHRRFGRLPWKDLFESAIYYAQQGFPVTEVIAGTWGATRNKDAPEFAAERRVFFPNGRAPRVGEVFRNPDLAGAYERIAAGGADAFYRGPIAEAILKTSRLLGGTLAAGDLAEFSAEWVEPISTNYRGWTVYELPPNGQGMAALQMLNILSQFEPEAPQSAEDLHRKIEAMKLAYADLRRYVADPRFASVPTAGLLSMPYAAQRARLIDPDSARCTVGAGTPIVSGDTTYLAVVDREGNIASWIQSVSAIFGSGVVVDAMGFHLHNRGGGFSLDPKHPNALAPRKRPFHTIIPAFLEKGNLHIGFG